MLLVGVSPAIRPNLLRDLIRLDDLLDQGDAGQQLRAAALSTRDALSASGGDCDVVLEARAELECATRLLAVIEHAEGGRLRDLCWSLSSLVWAIMARSYAR